MSLRFLPAADLARWRTPGRSAPRYRVEAPWTRRPSTPCANRASPPPSRHRAYGHDRNHIHHGHDDRGDDHEHGGAERGPGRKRAILRLRPRARRYREPAIATALQMRRLLDAGSVASMH